MDMENNEQPIIERLRRGEIIICEECKKGIYITNASDISISHEFYCERCGSVIRVTPGDVIVE